jgi:hypothetical protein
VISIVLKKKLFTVSWSGLAKRQAQLTIWSQKQLHSAAAAATANQRFQQQQLVLIKTPKLYCTSHQSVPAPNDQLQPPSTPRSRRRVQGCVCVIDAWVDRRRGIIISACLYVLTAPHLSARPKIPPHEPSCPPAHQSSTPSPLPLNLITRSLTYPYH